MPHEVAHINVGVDRDVLLRHHWRITCARTRYFEKGLGCMLSKLAMLLHSKIGIAIVGAVVVAGGGAAVATATGVTSHLPLVSFAQNGSHNHDDATKTSDGVGEHQELEGVV